MSTGCSGGAFDYFEKGQEPDELYHRIDKALEEKALREENENLRRQVEERVQQFEPACPPGLLPLAAVVLQSAYPVDIRSQRIERERDPAQRAPTTITSNRSAIPSPPARYRPPTSAELGTPLYATHSIVSVMARFRNNPTCNEATDGYCGVGHSARLIGVPARPCHRLGDAGPGAVVVEEGPVRQEA